MSDVLLLHSTHLFHDSKQTEKMQPYPPLQTMLAASVLRQAGLRVDLFDVTFENPLNKITPLLESCNPRLVIVCEDSFNFLTKMCLSRNRELAFEIARRAKSLGIPSAAYGPDASDHTAEYLAAGFDFVLLGEVEQTLLELARNQAPTEIDGLAFL